MFQGGTSCYQTQLLANQAIASSQAGGVVLIGGQSNFVVVGSFTEYSITYYYYPLDGAENSIQTFYSTPLECQSFDASDAVQIGWAIALVWLSVYGITFISTYLKRETFGATDDT